ncbi:FAS1-like dehydratase domain-containing protein [Pseudonocardia oroxyli]|uniref:3-methylfumaryl-CoA hydratase n=1 Tax=Pseudonocardia oroxyli TaxID=366584 RepID=A0A1G7YN81_PSEOR|nr:MaoC family dehydratase N-terminal domain-containing protein [Pseudonocardia oroxyli]SDG97921.1 3-methylfumaryl-CoA hydratase [Pseudonocardia oroxyli]
MAIADHVQEWEPRPVEVTETISATPSTAFAGLLDQTPPVTELPPLWTVFHFLELTPTAELGEDGHPREGHFLPPIPHRRRMFAGGRLTLHAPIRFGDTITRRSALTSITPKSGRSGDMLFVTLRHEYVRDGAVVQTEEQDVVYRQQEPGAPRAAAPTVPEPGPAPAEPHVALTPDEVLLFRFSALTYNAHRIHHDLPYATAVERYPGLVVHGPLLALLVLEVPRRAGRCVAAVDYRLRRPAFAHSPLVGTATAAGVRGAEPSVTASLTLAP